MHRQRNDDCNNTLYQLNINYITLKNNLGEIITKQKDEFIKNKDISSLNGLFKYCMNNIDYDYAYAVAYALNVDELFAYACKNKWLECINMLYYCIYIDPCCYCDYCKKLVNTHTLSHDNEYLNYNTYVITELDNKITEIKLTEINIKNSLTKLINKYIINENENDLYMLIKWYNSNCVISGILPFNQIFENICENNWNVCMDYIKSYVNGNLRCKCGKFYQDH